MMSRYPALTNSRAAADFFGRQIAAVTATLPPDVVAAAQERGQTRDVWDAVAELLVELGG
jgi:hypothetical protein